MVRLNITIPEEIGKELKQIRNKSQYIAQAIREKLKREQKEKLEQELIEGYKANYKEDKKINQEWEATLNDGLE